MRYIEGVNRRLIKKDLTADFADSADYYFLSTDYTDVTD